LLEEELNTIAAVNIIHEDDAFASDELQFEDDISEQKFVHF